MNKRDFAGLHLECGRHSSFRDHCSPPASPHPQKFGGGSTATARQWGVPHSGIILVMHSNNQPVFCMPAAIPFIVMILLEIRGGGDGWEQVEHTV